MSLLKYSRRETASFLAISMTLAVAVADDTFTGQTTPHASKLSAMIEKGDLTDESSIQRAVVTCGTNKFLMVIPGGLQMEAMSDKIVFTPSDDSYQLVFCATGLANTETCKIAACRKLISDRFPGAKISKEYSLTAAGQSGPAFELLWTPQGNMQRFVQVAYIPSGAGILEFTLIANSQNNDESNFAFNGLIKGFRVSEKGRLEIVRYSGNS